MNKLWKLIFPKKNIMVSRNEMVSKNELWGLVKDVLDLPDDKIRRMEDIAEEALKKE